MIYNYEDIESLESVSEEPGLFKINFKDGGEAIHHIFEIDLDKGGVYKFQGDIFSQLRKKKKQIMYAKDSSEREKRRKSWDEYVSNHDGYWHRFLMRMVNRKTEDGRWI